MKPNEQQQLKIGSSVWCVHPHLTHLLETRVTEMRIFNINWDEPQEPVEEAIEYTLVGVGCELPFSENNTWKVYDGEIITDYLGEQESYFSDKKVAELKLVISLRMIADNLLLKTKNNDKAN